MERNGLLTSQSSAAFVVGSVITFLVANGLTEGISKGDVVAMAMASEHRMGLRTGGMDVSVNIIFRSDQSDRSDRS
jgi:galactokinase